MSLSFGGSQWTNIKDYVFQAPENRDLIKEWLFWRWYRGLKFPLKTTFAARCGAKDIVIDDSDDFWLHYSAVILYLYPHRAMSELRPGWRLTLPHLTQSDTGASPRMTSRDFFATSTNNFYDQLEKSVTIIQPDSWSQQMWGWFLTFDTSAGRRNVITGCNTSIGSDNNSMTLSKLAAMSEQYVVLLEATQWHEPNLVLHEHSLRRFMLLPPPHLSPPTPTLIQQWRRIFR